MKLNIIKTVINKALQSNTFLIKMTALVIILLLKDIFGGSIVNEFTVDIEDFTPNGLLRYMKQTISPPKLNASIFFSELNFSENQRHRIGDILSKKDINKKNIWQKSGAYLDENGIYNCHVNSGVKKISQFNHTNIKVIGRGEGKSTIYNDNETLECLKPNSNIVVNGGGSQQIDYLSNLKFPLVFNGIELLRGVDDLKKLEGYAKSWTFTKQIEDLKNLENLAPMEKKIFKEMVIRIGEKYTGMDIGGGIYDNLSLTLNKGQNQEKIEGEIKKVVNVDSTGGYFDAHITKGGGGLVSFKGQIDSSIQGAAEEEINVSVKGNSSNFSEISKKWAIDLILKGFIHGLKETFFTKDNIIIAFDSLIFEDSTSANISTDAHFSAIYKDYIHDIKCHSKKNAITNSDVLDIIADIANKGGRTVINVNDMANCETPADTSVEINTSRQ